jgi:hypothetical protein
LFIPTSVLNCSDRYGRKKGRPPAHPNDPVISNE